MESKNLYGGRRDDSYKKYFPEYKLEELVMVAFRNMLEIMTENGPLDVKGLINYAAYGEFADHFQDQLLCELRCTTIWS